MNHSPDPSTTDNPLPNFSIPIKDPDDDQRRTSPATFFYTFLFLGLIFWGLFFFVLYSHLEHLYRKHKIHMLLSPRPSVLSDIEQNRRSNSRSNSFNNNNNNNQKKKKEKQKKKSKKQREQESLHKSSVAISPGYHNYNINYLSNPDEDIIQYNSEENTLLIDPKQLHNPSRTGSNLSNPSSNSHINHLSNNNPPNPISLNQHYNSSIAIKSISYRRIHALLSLLLLLLTLRGTFSFLDASFLKSIGTEVAKDNQPVII